MNSADSKGQFPAPPSDTDRTIDDARREAIGRLGRYAAYTAPALLVMLTGEASAQSDSFTKTH